MVPGIKKIIHSYTTSVWVPFLLVVFFLLIVSILVISGGMYVKSPLRLSTDFFIKLYACSLLGQLYVSFWHFFAKGTRTGNIFIVFLCAFSFLESFFGVMNSVLASYYCQRNCSQKGISGTSVVATFSITGTSRFFVSRTIQGFCTKKGICDCKRDDLVGGG